VCVTLSHTQKYKTVHLCIEREACVCVTVCVREEEDTCMSHVCVCV